MRRSDALFGWVAVVSSFVGAISAIGLGESPGWPLIAACWILLWMRKCEEPRKP